LHGTPPRFGYEVGIELSHESGTATKKAKNLFRGSSFFVRENLIASRHSLRSIWSLASRHCVIHCHQQKALHLYLRTDIF
jgi:hypothetical protein